MIAWDKSIGSLPTLMDWIWAAVISAIILGVYDLLKKRSVTGNAVLPVLFWAQVSAALVWLPLLLVGRYLPGTLPAMLEVSPLGWLDHLRLFAKSALVGASWIFAYFALKHLPVSVASPIRATGPIWTLGGAILLLAERPSAGQWLGIGVTLIGFMLLSLASRREGIVFHRDRWVFYMIAATLLGAASGLYDRYLLGVLGYRAATVQAWFSMYLVVFFAPFAYGWWRSWWPRGQFTWRWTIPLIGLSLLVADFVYFWALEQPDALISVVSSLRRGGAVVAFLGGLFFFREVNGWRKLPGVLGIFLGVVLLILL